jgi:KEOPS complex subunit Cgi121
MSRSDQLIRDDQILLDRYRVVSGNVQDWLHQLSLSDDKRKFVIVPINSVYSEIHLRMAIQQAWKSLKKGTNRANDPSIEVMRYLTGSRQVSRAIDLLEVKPGDNILLIGLPLNIGITEPPLDPPETMETEIEMIKGVHLERISVENDVSSTRVIYPQLKDIPDDELEMAVLEMVAMTDI